MVYLSRVLNCHYPTIRPNGITQVLSAAMTVWLEEHTQTMNLVEEGGTSIDKQPDQLCCAS